MRKNIALKKQIAQFYSKKFFLKKKYIVCLQTITISNNKNQQ